MMQGIPPPMYNREELSLKQIRVPVSEGLSLVFSNDLCYHRVCKLHGNGSRKLIAFFLLRDGLESVLDRDRNVMNQRYPMPMMPMMPNFNGMMNQDLSSLYSYRMARGVISARNVVVNLKYHSKHFVESNLRQILSADEYGARGNEWLIELVSCFVVGDRKYVERAMDINRRCRLVQAQQAQTDQAELTAFLPFPVASGS